MSDFINCRAAQFEQPNRLLYELLGRELGWS